MMTTTTEATDRDLRSEYIAALAAGDLEKATTLAQHPTLRPPIISGAFVPRERYNVREDMEAVAAIRQRIRRFLVLKPDQLEREQHKADAELEKLRKQREKIDEKIAEAEWRRSQSGGALSSYYTLCEQLAADQNEIRAWPAVEPERRAAGLTHERLTRLAHEAVQSRIRRESRVRDPLRDRIRPSDGRLSTLPETVPERKPKADSGTSA